MIAPMFGERSIARVVFRSSLVRLRLPLPTPAEQTYRAEAGGEKGQRAWKWGWKRRIPNIKLECRLVCTEGHGGERVEPGDLDRRVHCATRRITQKRVYGCAGDRIASGGRYEIPTRSNIDCTPQDIKCGLVRGKCDGDSPAWLDRKIFSTADATRCGILWTGKRAKREWGISNIKDRPGIDAGGPGKRDRRDITKARIVDRGCANGDTHIRSGQVLHVAGRPYIERRKGRCAAALDSNSRGSRIFGKSTHRDRDDW
jgi:hypothetical protein